MPDTNAPTAPTVAGGFGLSREDIDRLFADQPAVQSALHAQLDQADAARTPGPVTVQREPCCPECAEEAARKAQEEAEHAQALLAAEAEGFGGGV